jgi:hypothetical protein
MTHAIERKFCGLCDRVEHDPFERSMPQFADQERGKKLALGFRRTREKMLQQRHAVARGSIHNGCEGAIDVDQFELRGRDRLRRYVAQRPIAYADFALARPAGKECAHDLNIIPVRLPQQIRQQAGFCEPF